MSRLRQKEIGREEGQVVVIATLFFLVISLTVVLSVAFSVVRGIRVARDIKDSRQSFVLAESLNEDVTYRLIQGLNFDTTETLTINGQTATANITNTVDGKEITVEGDVENAIRRIKTELEIGGGVAFNFGVQTDEGGFHMKNSSSINGNLFSNGFVTGANSNVVRGDVISAGPGGLIDGINATGTAYAHSITNSDIEGDAYYDTNISGTIVGGTKYPGSADQATSSLPITDVKVGEWKTQAEAGGTITCNGGSKHEIDSSTTIGPNKIPCDLVIKDDPVVDIVGHIWVEGDIEIQNSPTIRVHSSLGGNSVAMIADNPSDSRESGIITIKNSTVFENSGTEGSYVLLLSQNDDAEKGGSNEAIEFQNSANGDVLVYAGHGEINVKNSANLREVTGYLVELQNSTIITYEAGLANLLFTSGPSGGYSISKWEEIE